MYFHVYELFVVYAKFESCPNKSSWSWLKKVNHEYTAFINRAFSRQFSDIIPKKLAWKMINELIMNYAAIHAPLKPSITSQSSSPPHPKFGKRNRRNENTHVLISVMIHNNVLTHSGCASRAASVCTKRAWLKPIANGALFFMILCV